MSSIAERRVDVGPSSGRASPGRGRSPAGAVAGWLAVTGGLMVALTVLTGAGTALATATGVTTGAATTGPATPGPAGTGSVAAGVVLLVLAGANFGAGYVAARATGSCRFTDRTRTWLWAVLVAVLLGLVAATPAARGWLAPAIDASVAVGASHIAVLGVTVVATTAVALAVLGGLLGARQRRTTTAVRRGP